MTKKIIAREGLVIIIFIICTLIVDFFIRTMNGDGYWESGKNIDIHTTKSHWIFFILFTLYAITRFIIWAVKTLREK